MVEFVARTIPHETHRYATVGDWFDLPNGTMEIRTSRMPDWRWELLVLLHETIEAYLCKYRGIPEPAVKAHDEMFEAERASGKWTDEEPGNDPRAPYLAEHQFAEHIEKQIAAELNVDWAAYEAHCASL